MSILSTTNTGLHGTVTEDFLLSLGLEKHKYATIPENEMFELFAFYNQDILPLTFRITFYNKYGKDNPDFYCVIGDRSISLHSREKVLLYLNYVKVTRELLSQSFNSTEELSTLKNEQLKFYNEIIK